MIFGDPMQGIFEFAGATLSWEREIHATFPLVAELEVPYRWRDKNPLLGDWIADARNRLGDGGVLIRFGMLPVVWMPGAG